MSFEVTKAPMGFMNLMNWIFKSFLDEFVIVFIDDILVYFKSFAEHERHLRMVLQTLRNKRLYTKLKKCEFWLSSVTFLGHIINVDGEFCWSLQGRSHYESTETDKCNWSLKFHEFSWILSKICERLLQDHNSLDATYSKEHFSWMEWEEREKIPNIEESIGIGNNFSFTFRNW